MGEKATDVRRWLFRLYSSAMEDFTEAVISEPQTRIYEGLGNAYSFNVPYSLVAEQFRAGDKFTYKGKTYEIKRIFNHDTTFDFACWRVD